MDALINYTICKHIHLIARNHKSTQSDDITSFTGLGDCLPINEIHTAIIKTVIPQQHKKMESIRSRIQQKLMVLTSMVQEATNHEARTWMIIVPFGTTPTIIYSIIISCVAIHMPIAN